MEKKDTVISIFTATFNRGYIIESLYQSLKQQTCKNFEWVVVDDGSSDNTEELFQKWKNEKNEFEINYIKTENGGLNRALNKGISLCKGDYWFKVDSDDFLTEDCIEKLYLWIDEIDDKDEFVAVGAVKGTFEGEPIKGVFPKVDEEKGYVDCTNLERKFYDLDADMCEAYKIDIIKKYPFPVWEDEKFCPEQVVLNELALQGYKIRWHKDIIYKCEYNEDGLTKGSRRLEINNPMGYAMMYNHMLKYNNSIMENVRYACQVIALSIIGKNSSYIKQSNKRLLTILCYPLGLLLSIRRKRQFLQEE